MALIAAQGISFLSSNPANRSVLENNKTLISFVKSKATWDDKSEFGKLILAISIDLGVSPPKPLDNLLSSNSSALFGNNNSDFSSLFGTSSAKSLFGSSKTSPLSDISNKSANSKSSGESTAAGKTCGKDPVAPSPKQKNIFAGEKKTIYLNISGMMTERDRNLVETQLLSVSGTISISIDSVSNTAVVFGNAPEEALILAINNADKYTENYEQALDVRSQDLAAISASSMFNNQQSKSLTVEDILKEESEVQENIANAIVATGSENTLQSKMRKRRMEKKRQGSSRFLDKFARALWAW